MNIDASEHDVTMELLQNGFDLIGLAIFGLMDEHVAGAPPGQ